MSAFYKNFGDFVAHSRFPGAAARSGATLVDPNAAGCDPRALVSLPLKAGNGIIALRADQAAAPPLDRLFASHGSALGSGIEAGSARFWLFSAPSSPIRRDRLFRGADILSPRRPLQRILAPAAAPWLGPAEIAPLPACLAGRHVRGAAPAPPFP